MFCCCSFSPSKAEMIIEIKSKQAQQTLKREKHETLVALYAKYFGPGELPKINSKVDFPSKVVWEKLKKSELEKTKKQLVSSIEDIDRIFTEIYCKENSTVFNALKQTIDSFSGENCSSSNIDSVQNILSRKIKLEAEVKAVLDGSQEVKTSSIPHEIIDKMLDVAWEIDNLELITQIERDEVQLALKSERLETLSKLYPMSSRGPAIVEVKMKVGTLPKKVWKELGNSELKEAQILIGEAAQSINNLFHAIYCEEHKAVFAVLKQTIDTFVHQRQTYGGSHIVRVQNIFAEREKLELESKGSLPPSGKALPIAHELIDKMLDMATEIDELKNLLTVERTTRLTIPFEKRQREEQISTLKSHVGMLQAQNDVYRHKNSLNEQIKREIKKTNALITSSEEQEDSQIRVSNARLEEQVEVLRKLVQEVITMSTVKVPKQRLGLNDSTFMDPNEVKTLPHAVSKYCQSPVMDDEAASESEGAEPASRSSNSPSAALNAPETPSMLPKGRSSLFSNVKKNQVSPSFPGSPKATAHTPSFLKRTPFDRAIIPTPTEIGTPPSVNMRISSPSPPPPIPLHSSWIRPLEVVLPDRPKGAQGHTLPDTTSLPNMLTGDGE